VGVFVLHEQIPHVTARYKGPKPPKVPPPPKPPAPDTAANLFAKSDAAMRQRKARGFGASIIGGYASPGSDRPSSILKDLLGQ